MPQVIDILDMRMAGYDLRYRLELLESRDDESRYSIEIFEYDEPIRIVKRELCGDLLNDEATARKCFREAVDYYTTC